MTRARWSLRCLTAVPGSVLPSRKITARNPAWVASKLLETLSQTTDTEYLLVIQQFFWQLMQVALQGCSFPMTIAACFLQTDLMGILTARRRETP